MYTPPSHYYTFQNNPFIYYFQPSDTCQFQIPAAKNHDFEYYPHYSSSEFKSNLPTEEIEQEIEVKQIAEVSKGLIKILEHNIKKKQSLSKITTQNDQQSENSCSAPKRGCSKKNSSIYSSRKNLTKYWGKKIKEILQRYSPQNSQIKYKIHQIVRTLTNRRLVMNDISNIIQSQNDLIKACLGPMFQDQKLLYNIYQDTNKQDEVKIAMIESFTTIRDAVLKNKKLNSWAVKDEIKSKKVFELTSWDGSYQEILNFIQEEYNTAKIKVKGFKDQSRFKNLTHFWIESIKNLIKQYETSQQFDANNSEYLLTLQKISQDRTLQTMKQLLSITWLRNLLIKHKLSNNQILIEILYASKLNLINKKNMIETYPVFKKAVYGQIIFTSWVSQKNKSLHFSFQEQSQLKNLNYLNFAEIPLNHNSNEYLIKQEIVEQSNQHRK